MTEKEPIGLSGNEIERLLVGDLTLYGEPPSRTADLIEQKLNTIASKGKDVTGIVPIPDYHHNPRGEGGIKDVLFITCPIPGPLRWETTTLGSDNETMYGIKVREIQKRLADKIRQLEEGGNIVRHVIPIIDSHRFPHAAGRIGRFGGLKDFVLCYQKPE